MTEVTPNLPHCGNFCKYCFMGTLLSENPAAYALDTFTGYIALYSAMDPANFDIALAKIKKV